ncbi:MAG: ABC transporter substrate-binding protein [Acidimicrobiia bacterium]|nr:ABC transporter substrate-binding protein [Acidimicrobiia bacterium]
MRQHRWTKRLGALLIATTFVVVSSSVAGASHTTKEPTGEPFTIGIVNSEGSPGLDFPEFTEGFKGAALHANAEQNGFGGRPVKLEVCTVKGTPESSQQCAQQLAEAKVDLVIVGLDVYVDFATFEAAGIPVIGNIPILPGDYKQKVAWTTGGNLSIMPALVAVAKDQLKAKKVGIVSTDNAAGNVGLALLEASLDKAGVQHTVVKGGDNETDAGYQGLVRQATQDNPDALISLYTGAGCVGTMRARAALGLTLPALAISTCATKDVLDAAGNDAAGWLIGGSFDEKSKAIDVAKKYIGKATGVPPSKANTGGFAAIGFQTLASLAETAQGVAKSGEVTGPAIFGAFTTAKGKHYWAGGQAYECGKVPAYPAVCAFGIPFTAVKAGGKLKLVKGGAIIDGLSYLP